MRSTTVPTELAYIRPDSGFWTRSPATLKRHGCARRCAWSAPRTPPAWPWYPRSPVAGSMHSKCSDAAANARGIPVRGGVKRARPAPEHWRHPGCKRLYASVGGIAARWLSRREPADRDLECALAASETLGGGRATIVHQHGVLDRHRDCIHRPVLLGSGGSAIGRAFQVSALDVR